MINEVGEVWAEQLLVNITVTAVILARACNSAN